MTYEDFLQTDEKDDISGHAFLGGSNYHWIRYTPEKLADVYRKYRAREKGTMLHKFADFCIHIGQRLPKSEKTLNMYVNDAITHHMKSEQRLYYSENCFGTADTLAFKGKTLRIHDYKSGTIPAHMEQLRIYAALYCLIHHKEPYDISIVLRIYQNDEILEENANPEEIAFIMNKIVESDQIISQIKEEEADEW